MTTPGYVGRVLRVDLTDGNMDNETLDEVLLKKWVGGVGLAAFYLYKEVPAGVLWDAPENRLIWTTGPLAGSGFSGAATINIAAKGPMTNFAGASQANGFFGAYLKFSGYDGIVFKGSSSKLVYLVIKEGRAELKDATHLAGMDTWETEDRIRKELGVKERDISVFGIGPAGENRVFYACIGGDRGHIAAHNGLGAVMGSKNLKAVVAFNGARNFDIHNTAALKAKNNENFEFMKSFGPLYEWGTGGGFSAILAQGALPVRNLTTNLFPEHEKMNGQYLRSNYEVRPMPCYRCRMAHVKEVTVTEGPYKGFVGEEPEYEQLAAWGPQIGNTELGATVMMTKEVDRLGMDCNEVSWCIGWAMECFEKGVFTVKETDGLELSWGNVEAAKTLLERISRRKGYLGNLLAEGVMRASKKIGGQAADWAVYTRKGCTPRLHDHRGRWAELFDTCVSNTSTLEATWGGTHTHLVDLPAVQDTFDHMEVSTLNAKFSGIRQFDDCVGICRIASANPKLVLDAFNAVTGWDFTLQDVFTVGLRVVNTLRIFNLRHGMNPADEMPSKRYGSVPKDGPAEGKDIMAKWPEMLTTYYKLMGWDERTGVPLPQTLKDLDLEDFSGDH